MGVGALRGESSGLHPPYKLGVASPARYLCGHTARRGRQGQHGNVPLSA
jgi:hypothetical protein